MCVCVWVYEYHPSAEGRLVIASRLLDPRDQLRLVASRDERKNAQECKRQEERLRTEQGTSARDREGGDGEVCGEETQADFPSADTEMGGRRKPRGTAF